jgi:copper chaperone for superoxide dismutase/copper chaperone
MAEDEFSQKVFGICRFVQIAPKTVLMDLTVRLPPPANVGLNPSQRVFEVYVSSTGNLVNPPHTTGKALVSLGRIEPDQDGYGDLFREVDGELWEWIGRGCVVEAASPKADTQSQSNGAGGVGRIFAGVVARSAGAWGNEKTVCACSGRTMWEEGRDMERKSML